METFRLLSNFALLIGLGMYGWASFFRRVPGAPGVGAGGRHRPWQRAEWFTPAGYRVRLVGFFFWTAGAIGIALTALIGR
jgi:hypothetical protein